MSHDFRETMRDTYGGVLLPTGFSKGEEVAFAHAVKLALAMKTALTLLYSRKKDAQEMRVRGVLENWGVLPEGSTPGDVARLGFWVRKLQGKSSNPRQAVLDFVQTHAIDLLVLATHGAAGIQRLISTGRTAPTANETNAATLFLPPDAPGFVNPETGEARLERILIPITTKPRPGSAIKIALSIARHLEADSGVFTLLHVGDEGSKPRVDEPEREGWTCEWVCRSGSAAGEILAVAEETSANLIVMGTAGRSGLFEALQGSTTERVVRDASCAVLALPEG